MRIEDLLEFEGLTAEMVRAYALRKGWTEKRTATGTRILSPDGKDDHSATSASFMIAQIADYERRTPQSLLFEINPRMRPGWPTDEEIEAHEKRGGLWMASSAEDGLSFGSFCADRSRFAVKRAAGWGYRQDADAEVCFWPCDAHGNKVSRGTR